MEIAWTNCIYRIVFAFQRRFLQDITAIGVIRLVFWQRWMLLVIGFFIWWQRWGIYLHFHCLACQLVAWQKKERWSNLWCLFLFLLFIPFFSYIVLQLFLKYFVSTFSNFLGVPVFCQTLLNGYFQCVANAQKKLCENLCWGRQHILFCFCFLGKSILHHVLFWFFKTWYSACNA